MKRYFSAHWIEYAETGLFFVGICALIGKLRWIPGERAALQGESARRLDHFRSDDALTRARKSTPTWNWSPSAVKTRSS